MQRTSLCNGHYFKVPMVSSVEWFHCIFILHSFQWCDNKTLEHLMYAKGGWVGLFCFLTNIFQISLKYLPNIVILCFQFVKFPWEKYMLRVDEDGRMLCLSWQRMFIFSNTNVIEKSDICWQKFLTSFNSITKSTCCSVRLNMMKR